jgi:hypothetical protein
MGRIAACAAAGALLSATLASASPKLEKHAVAVTNHRASAVVALGFAPDESPVPARNLLKAPLGSGKTVHLTVAAPAGTCSFSVAGHYEDGIEIVGAGLDLCNDHALTLVD